ncbi:hypothetical protein D869_gp240 [Caulobacter phage CcrRogue]|uniref:Uncharacterized protein n=1 Tax=Caulobacter phage CcrRogue TaxID=2927986 RepID=K4JN80_9CAUD|nr:hypothetical protein D869_gp240 [Caulobacter phage CcrRogue]AFU86674.1 hypothetical protein CcrRogue_gp192 [Caulobacter phage CcrRogue]
MSTTKLATRESFRVEMRPLATDPNKRQNHVVAVCRKCDRDDAVPVTTRSPHIPAELASKIFRKRGWAVGANRNKDTCPSCHGRAKQDSAPVADRDDIAIDTAIQVVSNAIKPIEMIDPREAGDFVLEDEAVGKMLATVAEIDPDTADRIVRGAIRKTTGGYPREQRIKVVLTNYAGKFFRECGLEAPTAPLLASIRRVIQELSTQDDVLPEEIVHYASDKFLNPIFEEAYAIVSKEQGVDAKVDRRKLFDGAHLRAHHESLTPEQRSELAKKGHATRKAKREAKIAEQREKKGRGPRAYWAAMTQEERSERQKAAAKTRLAKKNNPTTIETHIETPIPEIAMPPAAAKTLPQSAEPPRAATPAENRRILEALDTHYDTNRQCYGGDMTDEKVSKELGLPRAWIAELRERVYGPERNEAQDKAAKAVVEQWAALDKLEAEMMSTLDAFDKRIKAQRESLTKVAASVGVKLA